MDLRNRHYGRSAFCLGTAPHLNKLDIGLLKDFITIGCNQLTLRADELDLKYICFQRDERFQQMMGIIPKTKNTKFIIPENIIRKNPKWEVANSARERVCPVHLRYTTPGHAEYFSFDLENCLYAGDSIAIEIQTAVWMGCNPIYVLGVDAKYLDPNQPYYDNMKIEEEVQKKTQKYCFPELNEWLEKVKTLLWARGIKLINAAGDHSSLEALPKIRLEAAAGKPRIAVTSKTFSQDEYLVSELKRYFPNCMINNSNDKLEGEKLISFLKDTDAIILGTEPFKDDIMAALPCLRYVSKYGVGLDNIDFESAKRHNVEIRYRKGVNSDSVAELTLAFSIMLIRRIDQSVAGYREGKWKKLPGKELAEMNVGVIGYGHVGKVVASKFAAMGVGRLLVNDNMDFPVSAPAEFVPLDYLLKESDIVTIHISMEERNRHFVGDEFMSKMKKGAFLVNTSRGEVLDEASLVKFLRNGRLSGAALDVYESEPSINHGLTTCPNLLTTCHIAGSSNRAIKNMGWAAIEGLLEMLDMEPV